MTGSSYRLFACVSKALQGTAEEEHRTDDMTAQNGCISIKRLEEIEKRKAEERMLKGKADPVQNSSQGKSRDAVAEAIGISHVCRQMDHILLKKGRKIIYSNYVHSMIQSLKKGDDHIPKKKTDFSKTDYDLKYQKENLVQIRFSLNKRYDADIIAKLKSVANRSAYLKSLIRKDLHEDQTDDQ